jgi:hypothetical protein
VNKTNPNRKEGINRSAGNNFGWAVSTGNRFRKHHSHHGKVQEICRSKTAKKSNREARCAGISCGKNETVIPSAVTNSALKRINSFEFMLSS